MPTITLKELTTAFGKKGKSKKAFPVPPPKSTESVLTADPKKEGIPVALQVQNRKPLTAEEQAKVDAAVAKAAEPQKKQADLRQAQKALKTEKARVRIEKLKAKKNGAASTVPLTGKDAEKFLRTTLHQPKPTNGDQKLVAEALANGKAKITKVAPVAKDASKPAKGRVAKAKPGKRTTAAFKANDKARVGTKTALIGDLLRRKEGCTTADVLKATGWPTVSMPQQAKALGVKLRKDKTKGNPTVYRAA